jgi:Flp pilus assembly protein TadG
MNNSQRRHGLVTSAEPLEGGPQLPHVLASRRGKVGREDGAAAVEFAIVATLFFMLVFGIIDFGFAFHSWNNAANAAREGARKAAVVNDPDAVNAIRLRTIAAASTLDTTKLTVDVLCSRGGAAFTTCPTSSSSWQEGDFVRVVVNYQYDMITPIGSFVPGLGPTLMLHSQSESRFEG